MCVEMCICYIVCVYVCVRERERERERERGACMYWCERVWVWVKLQSLMSNTMHWAKVRPSLEFSLLETCGRASSRCVS
jgi:hypothetical protein